MIYAVISLVISLVAIVGLRQIDKKNNSIERMKQYVDRASAEMQEFFNEKQKDLKMLNDDLRAQQSESIAAVKSLKELSEHFHESYSDIESKQGVIDELYQQMGEANAKFQQILDMSQLVDVSIRQIKDESKFIDSISMSMKKAKQDLESVQGEITELHNTFQEENNKTLELYKQNILESMSNQLEHMNQRLRESEKQADGVLEVAKIKLDNIYADAIEQATKNASSLEGEAFETLKLQSADRVKKYKQDLEEVIQSTQDLASSFKIRWQEDATGMVANLQAYVDNAKNQALNQLAEIDKRTKDLEAEVLLKTKRFDETITQNEQVMAQRISTATDTLNEKIEKFNTHTDTRIEKLKEQSEYKMQKLDAVVADFETVETNLKTLLQNVIKQVDGTFDAYRNEHNQVIANFSESFTNQAGSLNNKVLEIEAKIEELKEKSYENVSEKLKVFEDGFFSDLTTKKAEMENAMTNMHNEIIQKLNGLYDSQEVTRKELEEKSTKDLQAKLVQLAASHKEKLASFDKQIKDIEANLVSRISAQDTRAEAIADSLKQDIAQAQATGKQELRKEIDNYLEQLKGLINENNQQFDLTIKKVNDKIFEFEQTYNDKMETANNNFQSWKQSLDKQFDSSRNLFSDKMSSFSELADNAIKNFQEKHSHDLETFKTDNAEVLAKIKNNLDFVEHKIENSKNEIVEYSDKMRLSLNEKIASASQNFDATIKQKLDSADEKVQGILSSIVDARSKIENTKTEAFNLIQAESSRLTSSMQDLSEKQNEYLSHTKLFEKTDELKLNLENNIKTLQGELGKLSIYNSAIDEFKLKYEKFSHQNDEVLGKIQKFMEEKNRVELLEQEFTKLAALSDSITKKQLELEAASDQMQKYQIQIRQLDDSILKVNEKYSLLDNKNEVLTQTIKDIDKAFANLNSIDASLKDSRNIVDGLVPDISKIKLEIDNLLKTQNEANDVIEKVKMLDNMQNEIEGKLKTLQGSKEWLAGIESRLNSLDETVTQRIKLFATVYNSDDKEKAQPRTTLSVAERQNIIDLHRQGWKKDQIASAMKCSIGEVELILEMSDKYE